MSRYSDIDEKTYRRNYDKPIEFALLNLELIRQASPTHHERIIATDCTFVGKSGKKTEGLDWFYNGSLSKSERGLEWSLLSIIDLDQSTGYPLNAQQTPAGLTQKMEEELDSDDSKSRVDFYLDQVRQSRAQIPKDIHHLAADAFYSKKKWVDGITALKLYGVGKLRCDANLKFFYCGEQKPKGRHRLYGCKVDFCNITLDDPDIESFKFIKTTEDGIDLYSARVYSVAFKRAIQVVYLHKVKANRSSYALLFSTDLELDPVDLVRYYRARFQIEFIFRDAKQFLGLTHCQARDGQKLNFHVNSALLALNVAKVDWRTRQQKEKKRIPFSMTNYKRRAFNERLFSQFIAMSPESLTLIKSSNQYQELIDYGIISS